jgi:uncharacterized integral membrane protein
LAGVTSSQLSLIAATGHQAPPGAHLLFMGVVIVGVVVAVVAGRRRRRAADELRDRTPANGAERERSAP